MKYFRLYGIVGLFGAFRMLLKENIELRRRLARFERALVQKPETTRYSVPDSTQTQDPVRISRSVSDLKREAIDRYNRNYEERYGEQETQDTVLDRMHERRRSRLTVHPDAARRMVADLGRGRK